MTMPEVGALYPLNEDQEVDFSSPKLPILSGLNVFGRTDSPLFTKQVSRKHISILVSSSGLLELTAEGPNAVVLVSGDVRTKLGTKQKSQLRDGDVVEFIPHGLPFRYISASVPNAQREEPSAVVESSLEKQAREAKVALSKSDLMDSQSRKRRQIEADEAFARMLQEEEDAEAGDGSDSDLADAEELDLPQELTEEQRRQIQTDEAIAKHMQDEEDAANYVDLKRLSGVGPDDTDAEVVRHPTNLEAFAVYLQEQREATDRNLIGSARLVSGGSRGAANPPAEPDALQQQRSAAAINAIGDGSLANTAAQGSETVMVRRPTELEEFTRYLHEESVEAARNTKGKASFGSVGPESSEAGLGRDSSKVKVEFKRPKIQSQGSKGSSAFSLLSTRDLRPGANAGTVELRDVVQGDICFALLSNYMVDITWLLEACPSLETVARVVVIHGESGTASEQLEARKPRNWDMFKPPLPLSFGTHHSKAMILVYPTGVRVVVHTANYIYVDFNNKTQGLWMQDFPIKSAMVTGQGGTSPFENDLVEYLEALTWPGVTARLPVIGPTLINANFFRTFDYSSASVRLVASVPGYHQGHNKTKWGHLKLRTILQEEMFEDQFRGSNMVYQFSSLGSLDEKWVKELTISMSAGSTVVGKKPLGLGKVQMVWPTVEDIRGSLEGYGAGNAVPSPEKNVKKEFLKQFWARWSAEHTGRQRAIPHMKSYIRYRGQSVAWFLLTSSNMSKAAWGALQKNEYQLMIRSYELGVCFVPSLALKASSRWFSCTEPLVPHPANTLVPSHPERGKFVISTSAVEEEERATDIVIVRLPVPYRLPPEPYGPKDVPWCWDRQYLDPDIFGGVWPRWVKLYSYN